MKEALGGMTKSIKGKIPIVASSTHPEQSPFLTYERAAAALAKLEQGCEDGDLDKLYDAIELVMFSYVPAPVWLCSRILFILAELRGQQKTGGKGVLATTAGVQRRNLETLERYLVVQKLVSQHECAGKKVAMKKVYAEARAALQAKTHKPCTVRTVQKDYLAVRKKITSGTFRPADYFPDNPDLAVELIGEAVQI